MSRSTNQQTIKIILVAICTRKILLHATVGLALGLAFFYMFDCFNWSHITSVRIVFVYFRVLFSLFYFSLPQPRSYIIVVVCLSVCLSVCLLATLRKNFPTDLHDIFREAWQRGSMNMWLNFVVDPDHGSRSRSGYVSVRDPDRHQNLNICSSAEVIRNKTRQFARGMASLSREGTTPQSLADAHCSIAVQ